MKTVQINDLKIHTSKGRKNAGEKVDLPDAEVAKLLRFKPACLNVLGDAEKPKRAKKAVTK